MTSTCRFPVPWTVEQIPGGYKVLDAPGQALVYVYAREQAIRLTFRQASNEFTPLRPLWS
jgi:hypothetical protein